MNMEKAFQHFRNCTNHSSFGLPHPHSYPVSSLHPPPPPPPPPPPTSALDLSIHTAIGLISSVCPFPFFFQYTPFHIISHNSICTILAWNTITFHFKSMIRTPSLKFHFVSSDHYHYLPIPVISIFNFISTHYFNAWIPIIPSLNPCQ